MTCRLTAQFLPLLFFVVYKLIFFTVSYKTSNSTSSYRLFLVEIRIAFVVLGPYYKSKLELKSNSSEIFPINCMCICVHIFIFALKVRLTDLKFEFCQFKLEQNHR